MLPVLSQKIVSATTLLRGQHSVTSKFYLHQQCWQPQSTADATGLGTGFKTETFTWLMSVSLSALSLSTHYWCIFRESCLSAMCFILSLCVSPQSATSLVNSQPLASTRSWCIFSESRVIVCRQVVIRGVIRGLLLTGLPLLRPGVCRLPRR